MSGAGTGWKKIRWHRETTVGSTTNGLRLGLVSMITRRGWLERATDRQLRVQDIFLRDKSDPVPQLGVALIEVAAVVQDLAAGRGRRSCEGAEQR